MPELISTKVVTARKAHHCGSCGVVAVQPGDTYTREVLKGDGQLYVWVSCAACDAIAGEVWEWSYHPDEGIGQDAYQDWAFEHRDDPKHGEAARAYLDRIGWRADR